MTVLSIEMAYGTPQDRQIALGIMRRLESAKTRRAVTELIEEGGEPLRRRIDRVAAYVPRMLRPLLELPHPDSALILWLWRDDWRHVPLWLLRGDRGLTVLCGAPVDPSPPGDQSISPPGEVLAGTISRTGIARRSDHWTEEIDIELVRLARVGLAYARARAVLVGRCFRYGVRIGDDADLLGSSLMARSIGQA